MPYFRSLGVSVPVILCANKSDLSGHSSTSQVVEDEMLPVMAEFKEIDSCIRSSAREHHNINELFYLCQKAVTHPIAPLYDAKESVVKPAAVNALRRIFYLCDKDQDGLLSDQEIQHFQEKVFNKSLSDADLASVKASVRTHAPDPARPDGIDADAFIRLNRIFIEKGRHETVWMILRKFNYTDGLSLRDSFLNPKFEVPAHASAELSPAGYRFFVDLFLLHDQDNDGGLNDAELRTLFAPTPGLPNCWIDSDFPSCTLLNDAGHVTLQGWLAQWSMTTFEEPRTTLQYLAYLGFETSDRAGTASALRTTKPRPPRGRPGPVERHVLLAYVLGASHAGKSSLLAAFLTRPFAPTYRPTIRPRTAVNAVELPGGRQCYLILKELGELEDAILDNAAKLDAADLLVYVYDSSDPDSFAHVVALRTAHPALARLPALYAALKADRDKSMQRGDAQPETYTAAAGAPPPVSVSVVWGNVGELWASMAQAATEPSSVLAAREGDADARDWRAWALGGAVAVAAVGVGWGVWRRGGMVWG